MNGQRYEVTVISGSDPAWWECERALLDSGHPLPVQHRAAWARLNGSAASWFIGVSRPDGSWVCGLAAQAHRSRALPGHQVVRVERFGSKVEEGARAAALRALADLARADPRVLTVHVELFHRDSAVRSAIARSLEAEGFHRNERGRCYRHTVQVDLRPSESDIFASLHATARRHVRAVGKRPAEIRCITDPTYGERLAELTQETLERTGGAYQPRDWPGLIEFAAEQPDLSRVVGLFRTDQDEPRSSDSLLAFAVGYSHVDHVEYSYAASTRKVNLRMPYGYAPAWDLICWAKDLGAEWFDFGGVTSGTHEDDDDPLGGISDFKRYFSKDVVRVGEEWVLEPRPVKAAAASALRAGANLTRTVVSKGLQAVGVRSGH